MPPEGYISEYQKNAEEMLWYIFKAMTEKEQTP